MSWQCQMSCGTLEATISEALFPSSFKLQGLCWRRGKLIQDTYSDDPFNRLTEAMETSLVIAKLDAARSCFVRAAELEAGREQVLRCR